jgi:uncharacterized membrane protein
MLQMPYFTSSISGKTFPLSERVLGRTVREGILLEIKKDHPDFSATDLMSLSEMNTYRTKYIQAVLASESGILMSMGKQVLDSFNSEKTLSEKLMLDEEKQQHSSFGEKIADKIAAFGGSWTFIISFMLILFAWIVLNTFIIASKPFDPYPFILLNLVLSCIAAMQAPVIMMSQNRQETKDRNRAKNDYLINLKSELEIRMLHEKIDHLIINQQETLLDIQQVQIDMMNEIMEKLKSQEHHQ